MSPLRGRAADDRGGGRSGLSDLAARAERVTKMYGAGDTEVAALRGIDLDFPRGRFTAIMGPSGSGKSTLMHCLAGLDTISGGRVLIGDVDLSRLSDRQLTQLRRDRIGFIFQQYNLLPTLTAAENITLPLDIAGRRPDKKWMKVVVDAVGLAPRLNHRPTELSGGQQQRVACARALITRPDIIFGDEPTGNLDSTSGAEVLSFLQDSVRELGQTVVMVTHDAKAASYADEVIFLADGRIVDTMLRPTADAVFDRMKNLDRPAGRGGRRPTTPPPRGADRDPGRDRGGWDDPDGGRRRVPTGPGGRRATAPGAARVPTGGQPAGRRAPAAGAPRAERPLRG
ncbi:ABC transporter ATP-binding protein, partial [Frankia sp. AgB1.9]|uniref:ABC transporter ATP-binding protein n=2 Tax=unclassified Frankia TaxID=2632575 RepID=UPI001EE49FB7